MTAAPASGAGMAGGAGGPEPAAASRAPGSWAVILAGRRVGSWPGSH